jgi:hypothetical protein
MVMGRLTATQIRNLKEPGRYNDGDGLFLDLAGPIKGNWQLRVTINGRRRDIGPGSLRLVSLKDAREAAFELRRDIQRGIDPVAERRWCKVEVLTFQKAALRVHDEQRPSWKMASARISGSRRWSGMPSRFWAAGWSTTSTAR